MAEDQIWTLTREGREHRVESSGSTVHRVRWLVDDEVVAEKKSMDEKVNLEHEGQRLTVVHSTLGAPRRATLGADPTGSLGGVDLDPAPGSPAASYDRKVLDHPTRYAVIATLGGVAKVVLPILIGLVAVRFAVNIPWPSIPFPDLPSIPFPDLPSIPFPDLPDLPDVSVPDWVGWLLDKVKYVWPVVLAFVLARTEIKRRRAQEERRRAQQRGTDEA